MKTNRNLAFSLAVLAALSCTRLAEEPLSVSSFDLSVDAFAPATKVTFEGTSLVWEGTEEAALIAGSESGYVAAILLTNEKYPGAFSGNVNLSPYSQDEIKAFAVPYSAASLSGGKLALLIPSNQTQAASGQINGAYVPVYHKLSFADLVLKEDGTYGVENLTLNWGCALLQFNVYGKHPSQSSSETLLSVAITTEGDPVAGTVLCDLASDSMEFEDGAGTLSVSLGEAVPLKGLNQSNGAKLFAAVLPRNVKVIEVTVETDQAIYTMNPAKELNLKPGEVHRIGLDLSKFTDREIATEYSTDGTNWTTAIPSRFSSLQVRGRLSNTTLGKIVSAVKKQTVPADLDLSGTRYESTVFPASFQATSSAPDVSLKSIKFPSNVTEIAEHAFEYCSALESVDLTGIETIGGCAFQYCGLKTLDIPNTVTSMPGAYTFGYNFALQSIYYNSPAPQVSGVNHHTFSTRNTAAVESLPPQYKPSGIIPLEFTFGPDAVAVRQQDFDTNHKLVKMTFKARPEFIGNSWIVRCRYIETFDLSEIETPPTSDNTSNMALVGELVPADHAKQILVPAGKGEAYAAVNPWKYLSEARGYTIVDPKPAVVADVQYSIDGTNWEESLPDNFTTLYVKGILNSSVLGDIREKFGNLEAGAALDLSQTEYSSEVFPALFGGESEGAGCTTITSIKFPSNVEEIAEYAFAYCSALESVELEGIKIINSHAFSSTGLKHLVIPNTVVSMPGQYHFGHCWQLESIYYNSPALNLKTDAGADATHHTFSTRNTAAVESLPPQYSEGLIPLEYTFGPDAKAVRSQDFDTNHKLVKMTFEAGPEFIGNSWIVRCRYIETFDLSAVDVPPTSANTSNLGAVGDLVPAGHAKQILVPAGKGEDYAAVNPWKYLSENKGYTIVDPQTPVEADVQYSADGSNWSNDIPASFSTLYVKGILTADELSSIKEAIDATTGAGLDMSAAEYSSSTFPAVLGGASKGNNGSADGAVIGTEGSPLTSVKFPSNVTAIADDAFAACSKLASVDLQGIKSIGIGSFKLSGLTAVSVPANVETVGAYAFAYTPDLETIVWRSSSTSNHAFSWRGAGDNANNVSSKPTVATFAAGADLGSGQAFDTNHKLVKVIFEGNPIAVGIGWPIRCTSLAVFDLRACTADFPAFEGTNFNNLGNVGDDVDNSDKKILVPSGTHDTFANLQPWKYLSENKGYEIVDEAYTPPTPTPAAVQYSADGSNWANDIPASFSTLYVKGSLTADELAGIKTAIDATSGAGLDMSAATYEDSTFPAVFGGASKGNNGSADGAVIGTEGSPLTSLKFPSNVTAIADDAFAACSKLASVDLQGIKSIGIGSFKLSGLTAVSVPANVESVGAYAFGYTPALASIYWNSPSTSNHAFSWRGAGDNANNVSSKPTTATFGANTTLASGQTFDTNHKLVKVIFEADPAAIGSAWMIRCTSLASFDLSACTADFPASASSGNLQNVGDDVAEADRIILVPSGSKDAFAAKQPWKYLTETKKYTIQEK